MGAGGGKVDLWTDLDVPVQLIVRALVQVLSHASDRFRYHVQTQIRDGN